MTGMPGPTKTYLRIHEPRTGEEWERVLTLLRLSLSVGIREGILRCSDDLPHEQAAGAADISGDGPAGEEITQT